MLNRKFRRILFPFLMAALAGAPAIAQDEGPAENESPANTQQAPLPLTLSYRAQSTTLHPAPRPLTWRMILEGRSVERTPKSMYFAWGGLSALAHFSADRDARSTIFARDEIRAAGREFYERNPLARPFAEGNNLRPVAHAGAAAANALSFWMLKQNRMPVLKGAFWIPQVAVILFTNLAANRNNRLAERCREGRC